MYALSASKASVRIRLPERRATPSTVARWILVETDVGLGNLTEKYVGLGNLTEKYQSFKN